MLKAIKYIITILPLFIILTAAGQAQAAPYVSASHYCLLDTSNGQLILSHKADVPRPVASTTKVLTAIVAVEYANLHEIAVVSEKADHTAEYTIGLKAGQELTVEELLKAALVKSANDAAVVLAEHVAGDERFFAHLMNKKAFLLGASQTHFENASGLPSQQHVSTAYDLAIIGRYALNQDEVSRLVAARQVEFKHPGYQKPLTLSNTNTLLESFSGANGIKTGTTNAAGKCLVGSARRQGRQLIAVALNSRNRSGDCARLLDYGFNQTESVLIVNQEEVFKEIPVARGNVDMVPIQAASDVKLWLGEGTPDIEKRVNMNYEITIPVQKGTRIGTLSIFADKKLVQTVPLVVGQDIGFGEPVIEKWFRNFLNRLKESAS